MQFKKSLLYSVLIILTVSACSVSKQFSKLNNQATEAFNASNYGLAYTLYDSIISLNSSKKSNLDGIVYNRAGIAAWEVGEKEKSIEFLEQAKQLKSANAKGLLVLAKGYRSCDNLSREIINLTEYLAAYGAQAEANEARGLLFLAFVRSENWDSAYQLWSRINGEQTNDVELLTGYVLTLKNLDKSNEILPTAESLLKLDPENLIAKDAIAIQLYKSAEERYQREMKAYQNNKTSTQYKRLLKQLDLINADFKIARGYLEELYKLKPEAHYATLLGNIYTRFENKSKANYYYKKAKQ
ncbi:MAG: hypothetical protein RBR40_03200 [Tenuifilaceae bacterium]|nr:hypothetical protein [Tenuifilaceae bacterium]